MKKILINTYTCLLVLFTLAFMACTDTENEVEYGSVKFSLGATRANTGDYVAVADQSELIKWYRVVITQRGNRQIIKCIDKDLSSSKEKDPMDEIQLSPGNYDVYAFANIDRALLNELNIKLNGQIPTDINTLRYLVPNYFNPTTDSNGKEHYTLLSADDFAKAGHYIPMTSLAPQQVQVTSRVSQTFNIEVRRLFAKLEFVFQNIAEQDLQVNSLSVSNLTVNNGTEGSILLMNYEESRDALDLLEGTPTATMSYQLEPCVVYKTGVKESRSFYVLESIAEKLTNSFELNFSVTRKDQAEGTEKNEYMRYALTDPNTLTLIHRNDWIVIPIKLGDYELRLKARSYPPIGGYPEAEIEESESNEFVVKFKYEGEFSIRPSVRKYGTTEWIYLDDSTVIQDYTFTVDTTSSGLTDIFAEDKAPTKQGSEILGTIAPGAKGTALVTLTVNIKTDDPGVTRTLTRKLYITI